MQVRIEFWLHMLSAPFTVGMSLTIYSLWAGMIKLFPARETLVNDIPAGDGKTVNLFYSVPYISK